MSVAGFEVDYEALRTAAREHTTMASRYGELESGRPALNLPEKSLGKLPQSDEILAAFRGRYEGLGEALTALKEIYTNIGGGLLATVETYEGIDRQAADDHARLGGR